jgi:DNA-binding transcriptional MerR regulator
MPIDDMRRFIALLDEGDTAAGEQRDLFTQQAHRLAAEIARMQVQLGYLRAKAELWDARDRDDSEAERRAAAEVVAIADQLNTTGPAAGGANNKRKEQ